MDSSATNAPKNLTASKVDAAKNASDEEHSMTLARGLRLYPKAIAWSVLLSSALVMEGYDLALLGSLYASPAFNKKFGSLTASGSYKIPASWQSALSNGARAGEVIGLLINGVASDRWGYRKTMVAALTAMMGFIFVLFFAPNVETLVVGEVLCGIPWGIFQTLAVSYASEVCPVVLRPYLTTYINMCWVFGQFVASGVNRGAVQRHDQWAYRIPFAVQWIWPLPILIGCLFAPESPWWHVRHGDHEGARRALKRLTSDNDPDFSIDNTIAMIEYTNELEKKLAAGTSYRDCFKGIDLRRTEIVCGVWIVQTLCGTNIMGYSSYFLVQAGLPTVHSFDLSMGQLGLGLLGTLGSWFLMPHFGRRTLHFTGVSILCIIMFIVGCLGFSHASSSKWAVGAMLIVFTFVYDFTVGPVAYSLVSEMSSTRLKSKTVVLARCCYNISNIVVNVLTNYQLSSSSWNWGVRAAYFWAGTAFICAVWEYFRLPEPKGRTYSELDMLFEQRVPARKFKSTKVDPFNADHQYAHPSEIMEDMSLDKLDIK
ncbi:general substrate transporter [Lipomyces doorenjongii]